MDPNLHFVESPALAPPEVQTYGHTTSTWHATNKMTISTCHNLSQTSNYVCVRQPKSCDNEIRCSESSEASQQFSYKSEEKPIFLYSVWISMGEAAAVDGMEMMQHSTDFLLPMPNGDCRTPRLYALVLLNYELPYFTPSLWDRAQLRICADGGANRLFDQMPRLFPCEDPAVVRRRYKPDVIKGDLDSIRSEVQEFYKNMGTTILDESHDQDTTDLHKCVAFVRDYTPHLEKSNLTLLVVGALGGRFDHELGNINVLHTFSDLRIVLLSNDSLLFLLPKNYCHEILVNHSVEGPHCGLIPVGAPSQSTTTSGLQWDLNKMPMRFGSLISTSNILKGDTVTVCSDVDLLWTTSIRKSSQQSGEC